MSEDVKCRSKLSDEMNQMIQKIVRLAIEEGHSISRIKKAIIEEFNENLPKENFSEIEIKLIKFFKKEVSYLNERRIKHYVMICSSYYAVRESGVNVKQVRLDEIATNVGKRLNLKKNTIGDVIRNLSRCLKWNFFGFSGLESKRILEKFYQEYMKDLLWLWYNFLM